MEKERAQDLQWFVDFANMNLNEIKPGDKAKLLVESEEYFFPVKEMGELIEAHGKDPELTKVVLEEMDEGFDWITNKLSEKNSGEYWAKMLDAQKWIREEFHRFSEGLQARGFATKMFVFLQRQENFRLSLLALTALQMDYIIIKLFTLLNGLPSSAIQKCPKCGKYFLSTTLRKKRFCSSRCLWRFNAEKRREDLKKHPKKYQAYLKKQKEIMRRKYEEKRKAEGYKKPTHYNKKED